MRTPSVVVQKRICCSTMVERHIPGMHRKSSAARAGQQEAARADQTGPSPGASLLEDLVGGIRRRIDEPQFRRQRRRDVVVRVPAGLKTALEAVFDHRSGAGAGEATKAEVGMCLNL